MRRPYGKEPALEDPMPILNLVAALLLAAVPTTQAKTVTAKSDATTEIKLSQAGYTAAGLKIAFVAAPSGTTLERFAVRDAKSGAVAFEGPLAAPVADPDSGDRVQAADFSPLTKAGTYVVEVPAVGRSFEFPIGDSVLARPLYLAMRSFYGQRCGTAVDLGPQFPGYRYPACHLQGAWHASSGMTGARESARGWHDAGDYGRYVVNSGISTGTLLWAFELFGERLKGLRLDIPESGNALPDVLGEVRWNLDWMLSMQDADGGVFHKQTSERFPGFVMPQEDRSVSVVIGTGAEPFKGSCATADFAAVMAIAGRVYRPWDAAYADRTLAAARSAFAWAQAHRDVLFHNPPGVNTGAYGDRSCADELLWAAAELWRAAGDETAHRYFLEHQAALRSAVRPDDPPGWANVGPLALWSYALAAKADAALQAAIRGDSLAAADAVVARSAAHAYRISLTPRDYVWGSNGVVANYGLQLLVANAIRPDAKYLAAARDDLYYLLGRNTFSLSWLTQVGQNPFRHPHHRPSGADANPEPWPGLLAGGPNGHRQDPVMQKLPAGLPPAKMYVDEEGSYASNEVAINWNAPLVFLLAGLQ